LKPRAVSPRHNPESDLHTRRKRRTALAPAMRQQVAREMIGSWSRIHRRYRTNQDRKQPATGGRLMQSPYTTFGYIAESSLLLGLCDYRDADHHFPLQTSYWECN